MFEESVPDDEEHDVSQAGMSVRTKVQEDQSSRFVRELVCSLT